MLTISRKKEINLMCVNIRTFFTGNRLFVVGYILLYYTNLMLFSKVSNSVVLNKTFWGNITNLNGTNIKFTFKVL